MSIKEKTKARLSKQALKELSQEEVIKVLDENRWDDTYLKYNALSAKRDENGFYPLHLDKIAIELAEMQLEKAYLQFDSKKERMKFMLDNGFYKKDLLRNGITLEDIDELYELYREHDIGEKRFYSVYQFIHTQAYKVADKEFNNIDIELPKVRYDDKYIIMEKREDRAIAVSLDSMGDLGLDAVKEDIIQLAERDGHPSTPTYTNGGLKEAGQLTSCFILKYDDTMESIADNNSYTLHLSKMGGGLGYDGTNLRAKGEMVRKADNRTHGVVAVAKMLEQNLRFADQDGKRQGSGAFYLSIWHRDIFDLLDAKKENTDESTRLSDLSIGLIVDDFFMQLMERQEDIYTFYPHTIYKEYGIYLSDINMSEMYYELVNNPRVRKEKHEFEFVKDTLASVASESGYPYFFFKDTVNDAHVFKNAKIYSSNLCTEILQRQDLDIYTDENGKEIREYRGVQCTLESLNVLEIVEKGTFKESMYTAMKHCNGTLRRTNFENIRPVHKAKVESRGIAVGFANFQGLLATKGIPYESDKAIDFARVFFAMMNFYSIEASMELTKVYGKFKDFEDTTYADGTYFDQYLNEDFLPVTDKVKEIFDGVEIPTKEDWAKLKQKVMKYGLANAYRLAIAPTGSISYSMGATQGIMPSTDHIENRKTASSSSAFYHMPNLEPRTYFMYKDAFHVDDFRYLDLVATIQQHIDQGISTTLFITDEYTSSDWWERIMYGWKIGLKTIYYARPKITSFQECQSCQ